MGKDDVTIFPETLAYFRLGLRELFKDKKFLLSYIATIAIFAAIIAVTSTELYIDGHKKISVIYRFIFGFSVTMAAEVYAIYTILGRYRKLQANVKIILECLVWATILDVASFNINYFILPYITNTVLAVIFNPNLYTEHAHAIFYIWGMISSLITCTLIASIFVWVAFYPHLVMENFQQHPLKQSIILARKNYVSLILTLALASYIISLILPLIDRNFGTILSPPYYDNFRTAAYIMVFNKEFLHNLLLLLPVTVFVAAFLRLTNEVDFREKPALPKLYTSQKPF